MPAPVLPCCLLRLATRPTGERFLAVRGPAEGSGGSSFPTDRAEGMEFDEQQAESTSNVDVYDSISRASDEHKQTQARSRLRTYTVAVPPPTLQPELSHKILVVGGEKAGKTCFVCRYAERPVPGVYRQTVCADHYVVPYGVLAGRQVYLRLVDVSHAEVYGHTSFLSSVMTGVSGVLFMFDATNPDSLQQLDQWVECVRSFIPSLGSSVPAILLAHKRDRYDASTSFIRPADLDRYIAANAFSAWTWTSIVGEMGTRSVTRAVQMMVEAILIAAAQKTNAADAWRDASQQQRQSRHQADGGIAGTLNRILLENESTPYLHIPTHGRPGQCQELVHRAVLGVKHMEALSARPFDITDSGERKDGDGDSGVASSSGPPFDMLFAEIDATLDAVAPKTAQDSPETSESPNFALAARLHELHRSLAGLVVSERASLGEALDKIRSAGRLSTEAQEAAIWAHFEKMRRAWRRSLESMLAAADFVDAVCDS